MPAVAVAISDRTCRRTNLLQLVDESLSEPLHAATATAVAQLAGDAQQTVGLRLFQVGIMPPLFGFHDELGDGHTQHRGPLVQRADRQIAGIFLPADLFNRDAELPGQIVTRDASRPPDSGQAVQNRLGISALIITVSSLLSRASCE